MNQNITLLLVIIIGAGIYLKLNWLAIGVGFALVLMIISEQPSSAGSGIKRAPKQVLHPVVHRDIAAGPGAPPLLYPENFEVNVITPNKDFKTAPEHVLRSVGALAKGLLDLMKGGKK